MNTIYLDIEINSNPETIFDLISTQNGLNRWWTKKSCVDLKPDGKIQYFFSNEFDWYGRIIDVNAPNKLVVLITEADEDWTDTILSFEIQYKNQKKLILRFEHQNWKAINDHFRKTSYCWAQYFATLKEIAEA